MSLTSFLADLCQENGASSAVLVCDGAKTHCPRPRPSRRRRRRNSDRWQPTLPGALPMTPIRPLHDCRDSRWEIPSSHQAKSTPQPPRRSVSSESLRKKTSQATMDDSSNCHSCSQASHATTSSTSQRDTLHLPSAIELIDLALQETTSLQRQDAVFVVS